jgi:small-conductance mechanosensitive channel
MEIRLDELGRHLAMHVALGLAMTLLLVPLRRLRPWRRTIGLIWTALLVSWLVVAYEAAVPWLPVGWQLDTAQVQLVNRLLQAVRILVLTIAGLSLFDLVVWEAIIVRRRRGGRPLPRLLLDVFHVVVLVTAVLYVLNQVYDIDLTALLVTSTVASVVIGLALQDTLRNLIAGIALQIDQPFGIGDWVTVAGHEGEITEMNWRTLTIRSRENNAIVLTNGKVAAEDIVNYARPAAASATDLFVGVAYGHPPGEVKEILRAAAREAEGTSSTIAPLVYVHDYGDFAVQYRIRVWLEEWSRLPHVRDAVMRRIWYRLRRAGFQIPFPIRDVNLRPVTADTAVAERLDREDALRRMLRPVSLFEGLRDDQIDALAAEATLSRYTAGERLFAQGDPGDALYVICAGTVRVDVAEPGGKPVTVARRGVGEFFGEMGLLTGEPRSATLVAETETEVVVLPAAAMAGVLADDPEVVHGLSEALMARITERDARLAEAAMMAAADRASMRASLVSRMRRFFGLPG